MPLIDKIGHHRLLLDTHILIWIAEGNSKICSRFQSILKKDVQSERILISAISIWEIGMLVSHNRLKLNMDPLDWVEQLLSQPGVQLIQISPRIAIQSSRLPGELHGDPADRILIATARELNACLVTHDQKILIYGKDPFITVHDPVT